MKLPRLLPTFTMPKTLVDKLNSLTWGGSRLYGEYAGEMKGDDTLKVGEEQQLAFDQQLQSMMEKQYGLQSAQIEYINSILKPIVQNRQGLSPGDLAAMRTSATENVASSAASAKQAVQAGEAARGGGTGLPSGAEAQIAGQMATSAGAQEAGAQREITQYNESVRQTNFWNAINGLSGTAAMLNPTAYAGSANQGAGALSNLGTAYYNSQQSGWLNAALGGLGAAAGGWASGGFKMPCWIAEAIWGVDDDRVLAVRAWLTREFSKTWYGFGLVWLYSVAGKRVAGLVRASSLARRIFTPVFTAALSRADLWLSVASSGS